MFYVYISILGIRIYTHVIADHGYASFVVNKTKNTTQYRKQWIFTWHYNNYGYVCFYIMYFSFDIVKWHKFMSRWMSIVCIKVKVKVRRSLQQCCSHIYLYMWGLTFWSHVENTCISLREKIWTNITACSLTLSPVVLS